MNGRWFPRLLLVAGFAVAFTAGERVARLSAGDGDRDEGSRKSTTRGFEGLLGEGVGGNAAGGLSWEEVKQRVVKRWEASPGCTVDFELREETLRGLEDVPAAELEAWMRELQPAKHKDDDKNVPHQLREMILMVLARAGGGHFIESLAENPLTEGRYEVEDALEHWLKHDPAAALDWLAGKVPDEIARRLDSHREDAFECLSLKDSAEFERRLSREDAEMREQLLERYAIRKGTGVGREHLLAKAAGSPHAEAMLIREGLLTRDGLDDPGRAYQTLAELELSPEDRAELDEGLVFDLLYPSLYSMTEVDGAGVLQAWMERNPGESVPGSIVRAFGRWSECDPERAAAWVADLPAGSRRDVIEEGLNEESVDDFEAFAGKVARISDADLRHAMQRRLKVSWEKKDANASERWEKGLPEEERERLREMEGE